MHVVPHNQGAAVGRQRTGSADVCSVALSATMKRNHVTPVLCEQPVPDGPLLGAVLQVWGRLVQQPLLPRQDSVLTVPIVSALLQERWLDNRDCAYAVGSGGELSEGERRIKRFAPFSDGIKNCLGQVSRV